MDLDKARSLAEASVLKAGRELNESRNQWAVAERVEGHDVKIAADHQAEALIAGLLHAGSGLSVFSEEAGWIGATTDKTSVEPYWVLDPLDGSANYLRGVPLCCVSLALVKGIEPLLGVIYDFNRNELFTGIASKGAWLNGVPMTVSNIVRPDEALLTTGFPVAMDYESDALREYVDAVRAYRKVRSLEQPRPCSHTLQLGGSTSTGNVLYVFGMWRQALRWCWAQGVKYALRTSTMIPLGSST